MSFYKKKDNTQVLQVANNELAEWQRWSKLAHSEHKWLIEFLNKAMEETMLQPDVDTDFKSVRSKFQTLKALRDKLINSDSEVSWRQEEIAKLVKEQEK